MRRLLAHMKALDALTGDLLKSTGAVSRMLEGYRFESELVETEKLTFLGTAQELANLLYPLLASGKLRVNGKVNLEGTIRVLDEMIRVCPAGKNEPLHFESLLSAAQKTLIDKRED